MRRFQGGTVLNQDLGNVYNDHMESRQQQSLLKIRNMNQYKSTVQPKLPKMKTIAVDAAAGTKLSAMTIDEDEE